MTVGGQTRTRITPDLDEPLGCPLQRVVALREAETQHAVRARAVVQERTNGNRGHAVLANQADGEVRSRFRR